MIHDVKDDPILQVPGQEPSMSSKYDHLFKGNKWYEFELQQSTPILIQISKSFSFLEKKSERPDKTGPVNPSMSYIEVFKNISYPLSDRSLFEWNRIDSQKLSRKKVNF